MAAFPNCAAAAAFWRRAWSDGPDRALVLAVAPRAPQRPHNAAALIVSVKRNGESCICCCSSQV